MITGLLNKQENRHYQILTQFTFSQKHHLSLDEIADSVGCSQMTLRKDIKLINEQSVTPILVIEKSNIVVLNLNVVYHQREMIIKKCEGIQLMRLILDSGITEMAQVQEKMGCSEATVRRLIKRVNVYLKNVGFNISLSTLSLEGPEQRIRSWLTQLFSLYSLPEDLTKYQSVYDQLKILMEAGITNDENRYFHLTDKTFIISIFVNHIRYLSGYKVTQTPIRPINQAAYDAVDQLIQLKYTDKEDSPEEIFCQLLFPYADPKYCLTRQEALLPMHNDLYIYFDELINHLSTKFGLENKQMLALHQNLLNAHYFYHRRMYLSYYSSEIIDHMTIMFPFFVNEIRQYMKDTPISDSKIEKYQNFLICTIILFWPDLYINLCQALGPIKILFIPYYNLGHARWLAKQIKFEISRHLEIDIFADYKVPDNQFDISKYDIIITQLNATEIEHPNILHIGPDINAVDLSRIINYVQAIKREQQERRAIYGSTTEE